MKTDKELIQIWEGSQDRNNFNAINKYNETTIEEKARLFDLIVIGEN